MKLTNNNYLIAIPSRHRAFLIKEQRGIWKYLAHRNNDTKFKVYIRTEEFEEYNKYLPEENISLVPNTFRIHDKREHMLQEAIYNGVECLLMFDDDVSFYKREGDSISFNPVECNSNEDYNKNFHRVLQEVLYFCSEEFPCVGFIHRAFSNAKKYYFEKNVPILQFTCYHVPTLKKEEIHFNDSKLIIREDQYVQLSLINKGKRTLSSARYITQQFKNNYKGGCSEYRTTRMEDESVWLLYEKFPGLISIRKDRNGRTATLIKWKNNIPKEELRYIPKYVAIEKYGVEF